MSSLSRGEAYGVLELPIGADADAIRTSYKRLAQKWHPEKNPKSEEAVLKFQKINLAYKRLITDNENVSMTKDQMYELYKQVMYPKYKTAMLDDDYGSSGDQDSCTTSDSENDPLSGVLNYCGRSANKKKYQQDRGDCDSDSETPLTAEQREKLANELITEEEKKKRQLEKRRLKKKQRREKKRLEKQVVEPAKQETTKKPEKRKDEISASSSRTNKTNIDFGVDANESRGATVLSTSSRSADVSGKLKNYDQNHVTQSPSVKHRDTTSDEVDPVVYRSRQFAIQGNAMACQGQYVVAVECFTKAIQLDSSDYRFFGNRSYCHERLSQFDKALKDANKVISLASDWPKGYFRKGKALAGLKNYQAAEEAFMQVLKLDSKCEDARQELSVVRTSQLVEMGFSHQQAQTAASQYDTVQQALDSLLAGLVSENPTLSDVYISDEEGPAEPIQQSPKVSQPQMTVNNKQAAMQPAVTSRTNSSHKKNEPLPPIPQHHYDQAARQIQQSRHVVPASSHDDVKMDPSNPEGLTSLWVGNVQPAVSQGVLEEMFSQFGSLQSVRVLPDKYCAFVNFLSKECAGRAMQGLQGTMLAGQPLLIKFPDNPLTSSGGALIEKPTKSSSSSNNKTVPAATTTTTTTAAATKLRGPVNGDECYFWRTTGCQFTTGCRYRHVPEHRGIDKKPWQKSVK